MKRSAHFPFYMLYSPHPFKKTLSPSPPPHALPIHKGLTIYYWYTLWVTSEGLYSHSNDWSYVFCILVPYTEKAQAEKSLTTSWYGMARMVINNKCDKDNMELWYWNCYNPCYETVIKTPERRWRIRYSKILTFTTFF